MVKIKVVCGKTQIESSDEDRYADNVFMELIAKQAKELEIARIKAEDGFMEEEVREQ